LGTISYKSGFHELANLLYMYKNVSEEGLSIQVELGQCDLDFMLH